MELAARGMQGNEQTYFPGLSNQQELTMQIATLSFQLMHKVSVCVCMLCLCVYVSGSVVSSLSVACLSACLLRSTAVSACRTNHNYKAQQSIVF